MNRSQWLRLGRDQLSTWLPALLMALFALGTWWLVRSAPRIAVPETGQPVSNDPDYYMHQFSVRSFGPDGRLRNELMGAQGQHYPLTDIIQVQKPQLRAFDEQGNLSTATAQRGEATGDGAELKLFGDARIVREAFAAADGRAQPRLSFRGEFLHAFVDEERVLSDQPVELMRGQDVFTGERFDYDKKTGVAHLQGRVRGVIQPTTTATR
ncbi:MAG: LPS export ABC transporter periplasmic protein LptC [Pseudomonadota bacterium]|nr:LPS export ABC transporter periplasmic protein LptC [Pseudomonadota bacterium]